MSDILENTDDRDKTEPVVARDEAHIEKINSHPTFSVVEPEVEDKTQLADRILSRIIVDLSIMRDIALRVSMGKTDKRKREMYQLQVEKLKEDISKLTEALSEISIDDLGMTEEEYSKNMDAIASSIEQAEDIFSKNDSPGGGDDKITKWFDSFMEKSDTE